MAPADELANVVEAVGEETLEVAETVRRVTGRDMGLVFFGSVVGTIGGLIIGAKWMEHRMMLKMDELVEAETEELRGYYKQRVAALEEREDKRPIEEVVQDLGYSGSPDEKVVYHKRPIEEVVAYHKVGSEPEKEPQIEDPRPDPPSVTNVFVNPHPEVPTPEWDYGEEIKSREGKDIFIIHRDEYMENAWEFDKVSLTYFEGDDILSNERDQVIGEQDETVGLENLSKFGHGSNDKDVVYLCNKDKAVLIEVTHSDGRYATEVHGFTEDDLQHSSVRRRPHRRSRYDDSD